MNFTCVKTGPWENKENASTEGGGGGGLKVQPIDFWKASSAHAGSCAEIAWRVVVRRASLSYFFFLLLHVDIILSCTVGGFFPRPSFLDDSSAPPTRVDTADRHAQGFSSCWPLYLNPTHVWNWSWKDCNNYYSPNLFAPSIYEGGVGTQWTQLHNMAPLYHIRKYL